MANKLSPTGRQISRHRTAEDVASLIISLGIRGGGGNVMTSTRRRFLLGAAAMGGAALGGRAAPWGGSVKADSVPSERSTTALSPSELLGRHVPPLSANTNDHVSVTQAQDPRIPTAEEVESWYTEYRNWGRWGNNDQLGAINLITPEKRTAAAALIKTGRTVSLSRVFEPEQQFIRKGSSGRGGYVIDYYGFIYHGRTVTHVDALCHMWDRDGMWNGRNPDEQIDTLGAKFGDITAWSGGIITRGVLIDVPRHRGESYVTLEKPVHGWELEEIARSQGVDVTSGDALLVHSGLEAYEAANKGCDVTDRPGLHASCIKFIRDHDVALLGWDLMDARNDYTVPFPVHGILFNYGAALLDNALLGPLAAACAEEGRYEFMFMLLPLRVSRGTGSPANPIAMF